MPVGAWRAPFAPTLLPPLPVTRVRVHAHLVPPHLRARALGAVFAPDGRPRARAQGRARLALQILLRATSPWPWPPAAASFFFFMAKKTPRPTRPAQTASAATVSTRRAAHAQKGRMSAAMRGGRAVGLQGRHSPTPPMMGPIELESELESPPYLYGAEE